MAFKDNFRIEKIYFQRVKDDAHILGSWKTDPRRYSDEEISRIAKDACDSILMLYRLIGEAWNDALNHIEKLSAELEALAGKAEAYHDELNEKIDEVNNYLNSEIKNIQAQIDAFGGLPSNANASEGDVLTVGAGGVNEWTSPAGGAPIYVLEYSEYYDVGQEQKVKVLKIYLNETEITTKTIYDVIDEAYKGNATLLLKYVGDLDAEYTIPVNVYTVRAIEEGYDPNEYNLVFNASVADVQPENVRTQGQNISGDWYAVGFVSIYVRETPTPPSKPWELDFMPTTAYPSIIVNMPRPSVNIPFHFALPSGTSYPYETQYYRMIGFSSGGGAVYEDATTAPSHIIENNSGLDETIKLQKFDLAEIGLSGVIASISFAENINENASVLPNGVEIENGTDLNFYLKVPEGAPISPYSGELVTIVFSNIV